MRVDELEGIELDYWIARAEEYDNNNRQRNNKLL